MLLVALGRGYQDITTKNYNFFFNFVEGTGFPAEGIFPWYFCKGGRDGGYSKSELKHEENDGKIK